MNWWWALSWSECFVCKTAIVFRVEVEGELFVLSRSMGQAWDHVVYVPGCCAWCMHFIRITSVSPSSLHNFYYKWITCICLSCARSLLSFCYVSYASCSYMCSGWVNKDGLQRGCSELSCLSYSEKFDISAWPLTTRGKRSKNRFRGRHFSLINGSSCSVRLCDKTCL